jgi:competence protein ComEC
VIHRIPVLAIPAAAAWIYAWWLTKAEGYQRDVDQLFPWVTALHDDFRVRAARWSGDAGALVPGLVLGNTDGIPESLSEAMRVTSLTHLMAVSGSNCAIVVGLAFGIAALCRAPLWGRVAASGVALVSFVVVVGPDPSVIRSSIMAAIGLAVLLWGRPVVGTTALCAAILVALIFDPTLSHSIGFALSVSATLGLLVLARPLTEIASRWMPVPVAVAVAIPTSAAIACQPIILGFSPYIPVYGVLANILAEPLIPIATVCGLLSIVLSPVPFVSDGLLAISTAIASVVAAIARTGAALPGARLPWPPGAWGVGLAALVSFGIIVAVFRRWRTAGALVAVFASTVGLASTVGAGRVAWASAPHEWSWAQCDVGQGDAVLVRDAGRVALIDAGRTEPPLRECLSALGITHIDILVITHFDADHVGGFRPLVGRVGTVLHGPPDGDADVTIINQLRSGGARVVSAERGLTGTLGRLNWRVLWPSGNSPREPGNPSSVTVLFERGAECDATCVSGLDLGDLPGAEQTIVRRAGGLVPTDVVKVSHHGSSDQDSELYRRVRAPVALIGVGADNEYGHPTAETLDVLAGVGSTVARSDLNGIVLVWRTSTGELRVWRERATEPRFTLKSEE